MSKAAERHLYAQLELEPFAPMDEVKSAYRRLARQYHPDLNRDNPSAEERFKAINEAYDTLGDGERKAAYDVSLKALLKVAERKSATGPAKATPHPPSDAPRASEPRKEAAKQAPSPASEQTTAESKTDPTSTAAEPGASSGNAGPLNDLFSSLFRGRQTASSKSNAQNAYRRAAEKTEGASDTKSTAAGTSGPRRRGQDVSVDASITPLEAQSGVIKTVNVQHHEACRRCSGTGRLNGSLCGGCNGDKAVSRLKKIDVRIPPGVKHGSKVRVAREGGRGVNGGDPGDLFLNIQIAVDPSLRIEGLDVHLELPIAVTEAVLGAELEVPTVHGALRMTIPAGTSSGKVFRLREQGVQNGQNRGDQYVTVVVVVPKNLTERERELYRELARLRPERPASSDVSQVS
jgi:molecular chaperone DnaJ